MKKISEEDISDFLNDQKVIDVQNELRDFIKKEYEILDNTDFIGESMGGLIKVFYSFKQKGFYKVEINDAILKDKECVCNALPKAINEAIFKFGMEDKEVKNKVVKKENDLFNKLVVMANEKINKNVLEEQPKTNKKNYLN